MLRHKDGNFMQALRRDEGAIRGLYEKVAADPRHGGEITLQEGFAEGRRFPDRSMGFRDLNSPEARSDSGYSEFLNAPLTGREFSGDPLPSPEAPDHVQEDHVSKARPRLGLLRQGIGGGRSRPWRAKPR